MEVKRAAIVAEARTWTGTRWMHQADVKGVGCDCIGLLRGVGINTGVFPADWQSLPGASQFLGYGRTPFKGALERCCDMFMTRITEQEAGPGDVVVMRYGTEGHHMAILADYHLGGLSIIHAYAPARKVAEGRLDDEMRARICGWYRFPGVVA